MKDQTRRLRLGFLGVGWIGRHRLESVLRANVADVSVVTDPEPGNIAAVRELVPSGELRDAISPPPRPAP